MNNLQHISSIEPISLPDEQIQAVPAKIDTGADSSAIWASSILEQDGKLSFVLFDKTSPYYTGKTLSTKSYKSTSVKNSFGQSEFRYKASLKLQLAGRTIRTHFTLANRANNHYPVLIGQRTLRGKFLVDVSKKSSKPSRSRVLLLSVKPTEATVQLVKGLQAHGKNLRITVASYNELRFITGLEGNRIELADSGEDIANFDIVHFKTTAGRMDIAAAAARYLQKRGVRFFDSAAINYPASSKLYQYIILCDNNLTVPNSVFMLPEPLSHSYDYLRDKLGLPFVLKDINGSKGKNNFLVENKTSFKAACQQAEQDEVRLIAQAFVHNDGDYRVLVLGGKIALVIKRQRQTDDTHLNNTSQGGTAVIVEARSLPTQVRRDSITAARLMDREIAGVDMVHDKTTDIWYCLEVNDGPQIATGSFVAEKHVAFAEFLNRQLTK